MTDSCLSFYGQEQNDSVCFLDILSAHLQTPNVHTPLNRPNVQNFQDISE